jgi:hypothetical protein
MESVPGFDGKLIFSEMAPEQITGLWPHMGQGIDETYRQWQKYAEWVPNDIFTTIKKDQAKVAFMYRDGTRIGFLIYRYFWEEFSKTKYLHIWLAYIYPEFRGKIGDYLPQWSDYFVKVCKLNNCKYIEMDTMRDGWEKLLVKEGMNPRRTVYRKEL